jgi:hypothetical protein
MATSNTVWRGAAAGLILLAIVALALFLALRPAQLEMPASGGARALLRLDNALGATVEPVDYGTARMLGISMGSGDFVVTSVANRGPAVDAGIHVGDVIERIGNKPAAAAETALHSAARTPILINRHGKHAIVSVDFAGA